MCSRLDRHTTILLKQNLTPRPACSFNPLKNSNTHNTLIYSMFWSFIFVFFIFSFVFILLKNSNFEKNFGWNQYQPWRLLSKLLKFSPKINPEPLATRLLIKKNVYRQRRIVQPSWWSANTICGGLSELCSCWPPSHPYFAVIVHSQRMLV